MATPAYEELQRENRRLREQLARLERDLEKLRAENAQLRSELATLREQLAQDPENDPPPFVKPRRRAEEPKPPGRKPGHEGTTRAVPERVDEERALKLVACPDCQTKLGAAAEVRERYVWDLLPPKVQVLRYRISRYRCPMCRRLVEKKPDDVLPGHHLSLRAMSAVVYLREGLRLPVNRVQRFLADAGLELSTGTIEQVCTEVAEQLQPRYEAILEAARSHPGVGIDETGLRVNGANHWLWVLSTPQEAVYHPDERRSHAVAEELVGEEFPGVVTCDFYTAYNPPESGQQRCWAHLLRETRELEGEEGQQLHQELKELRTWIEAKLGRAPPPGRRERLASFGEWAITHLAEQAWTDPQCRRIVQRLRRYAQELFTYVRRPGAEATNNGAERALRPYVVKRKISGGHRTWAGTRKHTILLSVLETCRRRGEDFRALVEGVLRQAIASAG